MNQRLLLALLASSILIFTGCDNQENSDQGEKSSSSSKTNASGQKVSGKLRTIENYTEGTVLVVMDTVDWNRSVGDSVRKIFTRPVYGLPQPEPYFKLVRIDPGDFGGNFKSYYNIVMVANLSSTRPSAKYMRSLLGKENLTKARSDKEDKSPFYVGKDVFLKGQNVVYVLANNEAALKRKLSEQQDKILKYFDRSTAKILRDRIYFESHEKKLSEKVMEQVGLQMRIPEGYVFAKASEDFVWLRVPSEVADKNIYVARRKYVNQEQFSDEYLRSWRDSLGANSVKVDGDTAHYMISQSFMPLRGEVQNINSQYGKLCRGLWQLKDGSLGGPYISYVTTSKDQQFIYYIEGFVAAPSKAKRKYIRDMRSVITAVNGN